MLRRKLLNFIELSWSSIWGSCEFDLHFIPPEVVDVSLIREEPNNGN